MVVCNGCHDFCYNACTEAGFASRNTNYKSPQTFQAFCLSKYNVALNGPGLATVTAIISTGNDSNGGRMKTGTIVGIGAGVLALIALVAWCCCASHKPMKRHHDPIQHNSPPGVNRGRHKPRQKELHVVVVVTEPGRSAQAQGPLNDHESSLAQQSTYVEVEEPKYAPTPSINSEKSASVALPVNGTPGQHATQLSPPLRTNTPTVTSLGTTLLSDKDHQAQEDTARAAKELENDSSPPKYQEFPDELR
ncbi:UNVERIFIED_CONTAM: hypothetical protein HDU68_001850 [Siphonaria sp. JEL0065]|nr:hypothetical protein HDU68_001850 [Siphonaria sp. JEL0065]